MEEALTIVSKQTNSELPQLVLTSYGNSFKRVMVSLEDELW